jgi:Na+/melibiose symporter-like transporter
MRNFKNKCNLCIQNKIMRKLFAVLSTIITLFAIKETVYIFISTEPDMVKQKAIMIVIGLSISIPLIILSLWLWSPGRKKNDQQN